MKLAPYPEYKDAGVSWVGSIPAHWPEKRAKYGGFNLQVQHPQG